MSIILDALKKAEAERHLGQLPGLHTPGSMTSEAQSAPTGGRSRTAWYAVAGVVALMAIATTWWLTRPEGSSADVVAPLVQVQTMSAPPVPRASVESPVVLAPASLPPTSTAPAREILVPPPLPPSLPPSAPKPMPAVTTKPTLPVVVVRDTQSRQVAAVAVAEKIMLMSELSPALQRDLPPLVVGGSMYSDNAAERMLLVDRRLLHEGDEVAPNLVLEKLMPKEAILRFRGTRFRIAF